MAVCPQLRTESRNQKIQIYWGMVEGAESFEIEADGQTVDVGLTTSYTHTGLLPNTEHTYRVRAGNKGGFGQWSAAVTVKTLMAAPPSMQYESGSTWILVTWSEVDGAERYDLSVDGTLIDNGTMTYFRHEPLQPDSHHVTG